VKYNYESVVLYLVDNGVDTNSLYNGKTALESVVQGVKMGIVNILKGKAHKQIPSNIEPYLDQIRKELADSTVLELLDYDKLQINHDKFLGKGQYGAVYSGTYERKDVAIKMVLVAPKE
jgi:hypothetical protein